MAMGQTPIVTSGVGRVQFQDGPMREMRPVDGVCIPPEVKHWHGATPKTSVWRAPPLRRYEEAVVGRSPTSAERRALASSQ